MRTEIELLNLLDREIQDIFVTSCLFCRFSHLTIFQFSYSTNDQRLWADDSVLRTAP